MDREKELFEWIRGMYLEMRPEDKKDAERFFPELAESEDERIRKMLLDMCDDWEISKPCRVDKGDVPGVRAWLKNRKPAWTEEDERIRKDIINLIEFALKDGSAVSPGSRTTKEEALAYLEKQKVQKGSLRVIKDASEWEKIKEQKPAEWSEEDDEVIDNIICVLQKDVTYTPPTRPNSCTGSGNAFYTHQTEIAWLKSLRPRLKQEWSEEDEKMLRTIISDGSRGVELDSKQIDFLKSLRPQPHWKPNQDDIDVLYKAAKFLPDLLDRANVLNLALSLKKLM